MNSERELKTVISGSFDKFKPEIDLTIDEFQDLNVTVLAPEKGWLYIPSAKQSNKHFRPLPTEIGKTIKQIEDEFLKALDKSDILYVLNPEGFIGSSASLEIGFAVGKGIPIFSKKKILAENDSITQSFIQDIKNAGAEYLDQEVVEDGNFISSRYPADIPAFIKASLDKLK